MLMPPLTSYTCNVLTSCATYSYIPMAASCWNTQCKNMNYCTSNQRGLPPTSSPSKFMCYAFQQTLLPQPGALSLAESEGFYRPHTWTLVWLARYCEYTASFPECSLVSDLASALLCWWWWDFWSWWPSLFLASESNKTWVSLSR